MAKARGVSKSGSKGSPTTFQDIMARGAWSDLPAVVALPGEARFMKELFVKRFVRTLFGESEPVIERFQGPPNKTQLEMLPLARVLDELRTPNFFSPHRVVLLEGADVFLAEYGDDLLPFIEDGFSGGYLIAFVAGKLDGRRRFSKRVAEKAWVIECAQPFDRPPPWDTRTPAWKSELSQWVLERARSKELAIDLETAFALHERAGTDLALIEEELEKLQTYLASRQSRKITPEAILAVVGDLHENSVFLLVDLFLEGRHVEAIREARQLFTRGVASKQAGPRTTDPIGIVLFFIGVLVPRLRSLRKALAMQKQGARGDDFVSAGLVGRPFVGRFERQLRSVSASKIAGILERLYHIDRSIKTGGDAERLLELMLVEFGRVG